MLVQRQIIQVGLLKNDYDFVHFFFWGVLRMFRVVFDFLFFLLLIPHRHDWLQIQCVLCH